MSVNGFKFNNTVHKYNYGSLENIPENFAPEYMNNTAYAVGDYCTYNHILYRCTTQIVGEAWNASHWTSVNIAVELKNEVSDLKSAIEEIEPGLSDEAKEALLACFEHVAWIDEHGQDYYDTLASALTVEPTPSGITIDGDSLENYIGWQTSYPYFTSSSTRIMYKNLDFPVVGGSIYTIKATALQENVRMYINIYNQNVLDKYAIEGNINAADHIDALGGWVDNLEQTIVIPEKINGSPVAGIVFGFKYANDGNISSSAIDTVKIQEAYGGDIQSRAGYTQYDYVSATGSEVTVTTDYTGLIKTPTYTDLNHVFISADFLPTNSMTTNHTSIMGARASGTDWSTCVAIYAKGSNRAFLVYSHTSSEETFTSAFTKGQVNHVELKQGNASPSIFLNNGNKHEITWTHNNVINAPMYLFNTSIKDSTPSTAYISNYIQLGRFIIWDGTSTPDIYVPAVRTADNVIGFYNVTKKTFITCSDTTKATIGHTNCVYQVGNWS